MKIETLQIKDLTPDPANARQHDEKNLKAIQGSLNQFGQRKPIVITEAGVIVAGNGTVEAAKRLGWLKIDAVRVPGDWTPEQTKAFALADNRTAELAAWNTEALTAQLQELEEKGWEIAEFGFEALEFPSEEKEVVEKEIPESAPARTALGDIWKLGNHKLYCGDSTADLSKLMGEESIELCFTSPPYSDQREYNGGKELSTAHIAKFISAASKWVHYYAVNLGMSRKQGALNTYWDDYINEAESCGLKLLSWNIWNRQGLAGFSIGQITAMFAIEHEFIFVFGKEPKKLNLTIPNSSVGITKFVSNRKKDGTLQYAETTVSESRQLGTVYWGGVEGQSSGNHPAAFPIEFPKAYIEAMTDKGQIVYDPFGGSGSTLIAAEQTGRICFISELDPKYCDIILTRWENLTGEKAQLLSKTL
jgi:DNA modification methylase